MTVVFKFGPLAPHENSVRVPLGATPVRVARQDSDYGHGIYMWFRIDDDPQATTYWFKYVCLATGEIGDRCGYYIGTVEIPGGEIFHFFKDPS